MRKALSIVLRLLVLALVTAAFLGLPYGWYALQSQRLAVGVVLTLLLGRFFCRTLCPLGILQSFVAWLRHPKSAVRRVCTRLPTTRAQRWVRGSILALTVVGLVAGWGAVTLVFPMSVFGKALTGWWVGLALLAIVLVLALFGQGRLWCNWVCPYGTVFGLLAHLSLRKDRVGVGCGNCRRCFAKRESADVAPAPADGESGVTRRETLKGVAVLAATEKLTDGGFEPVSLPGSPERAHAVLPPGAVSVKDFVRKCVGCQLCVANCPGQCLKPSTSLKTFGVPTLDFRCGYCLLNCAACARVCPEHALLPLQREQRPHVHVGFAVWSKERCVRTTNGDPCTACVRKCPVQAIHLVQGFPVVDRNQCIGCGACEHVCPARPLPAIVVEGYAQQRIVNPISEGELKCEMRARLEAGSSVVVAKGGVIVAERSGRGLAPLMELYEAGRLEGALVMDKVIGRAAAAICAAGKAKHVCTLLAGKGAAELLEKHGIRFEALETVERILNHDRNGSCPMEQAVEGLDDVPAMLEALKKAQGLRQ